jgi:hypothetical protein
MERMGFARVVLAQLGPGTSVVQLLVDEMWDGGAAAKTRHLAGL